MENSARIVSGRDAVDCPSALYRLAGAATPQGRRLDSTAAVQGRRGDRKQSEKEKGRMKTLKRIFAVLALLSAVLLISYLAFTGGQV